MSVVSNLRTGGWLTADRATAYPRLFLVVITIAAIYWIYSAEGYLDRTGTPLGTDFLNQYAASVLIERGTPELAYELEPHARVEYEVIGNDEFGYYGWHYPPMALLIVVPFAIFSYGLALAGWMLLTLAFNLLIVRLIANAENLLVPALAFPAVIINIGHGHNGFLSAGLLGGALLLLARQRELAAGILIGLLAYKPQFGMLIPVALAAGGHWRAFSSAAITVLAFAGLSWLAFGTVTWEGFFASSEFTRTVILEQGATGWRKIQSFFSLVRGLGGSIGLAYAVQLFATAVLALIVFRLWRSQVSFNIKAAGLVAASLAATPYLLDYDLVILGLAIIYLVREGLERGFRDWEISLLALLWVWPLVARSIAGLTSVQFTPLLLCWLIYLLYRRSRQAI